MYEYKCTVDRVVDGDTIDVTLDLGFSVLYKTRVRLYGIDTPESRTRNKDEKARGKMSAMFLKMAIEDAGLKNISEHNKLRIGVSVGSGIGGLETIYEGSLTINNKEQKKLSPFFIPSSLVNLLSGQISIKYGFK